MTNAVPVHGGSDGTFAGQGEGMAAVGGDETGCLLQPVGGQVG
jgi:hypothetical protein